MKRAKFFLFLAIALFITTNCNNNKNKGDNEQAEDLQAKKSLQGIWIDEDTETVLFKIEGDSIFYPDSTAIPLKIKVVKDSLYLIGNETTAFKIDKRTDDALWFHSMTDDTVKAYKSEDPADSLYFIRKSQPISENNEVIKKDSIIFYQGKRYHGYVYINPTKIKVTKTSYTDEGISSENIYYDNYIHICVYDQKNCLFSKDVKKRDFKGSIPSQFLNSAILKNMDFTKVNADGYHFEASLCIPDEASCYLIEMVISKDGKIIYKDTDN